MMNENLFFLFIFFWLMDEVNFNLIELSMLKFFGMYYEISDQQWTLVTARVGLYFYFMLKFAMILLLYFILYECFIFTLTWLVELFCIFFVR